MTTVQVLVNAMTSSDFLAADVTSNIEVSYKYCSAILGEDLSIAAGAVGNLNLELTNGNEEMACVLLAQAILIESRRVIKSRTEDIEIRTIDQLFTPEMRNMLLVADAADENEVAEGIMWSNTNPSLDWEV